MQALKNGKKLIFNIKLSINICVIDYHIYVIDYEVKNFKFWHVGMW